MLFHLQFQRGLHLDQHRHRSPASLRLHPDPDRLGGQHPPSRLHQCRFLRRRPRHRVATSTSLFLKRTPKINQIEIFKRQKRFQMKIV